MKIGFNLLPYSVGKHGGAEVYFKSVIGAFQKMTSSEDIYLFGNSATTSAYNESGKCKEVQVTGTTKFSRLTRSSAEQLILPSLCKKVRLDCLVSNYVTPLFLPCKSITIVHDLLYKRYPESLEFTKLMYWRAMLPLSISRSTAVVAVSQFSADEIANFFPSAKEKVFVTVEGVRPSFKRIMPAHRLATKISSKYLLCVATFGRHKNLHSLLSAFSSIAREFPDIELVYVGAARTPDAQQYKKELIELATREGIASRVIFTGHVSDEELASLYHHAIACVLPSLYEGFGLPIIEAQYFECPVLCSRTASMPEVSGGAALFFDPTSVEAIRAALIALLTDNEIPEQLRKAGLKNVSRFFWGKAAEQLMTAIEFAASVGRNKSLKGDLAC